MEGVGRTHFPPPVIACGVGPTTLPTLLLSWGGGQGGHWDGTGTMSCSLGSTVGLKYFWCLSNLEVLLKWHCESGVLLGLYYGPWCPLEGSMALRYS